MTTNDPFIKSDSKTDTATEKAEQTISERVTAAAMEAAALLAGTEGDDNRNVIIVAPVIVFSNCAEVNA